MVLTDLSEIFTVDLVYPPNSKNALILAHNVSVKK